MTKNYLSSKLAPFCHYSTEKKFERYIFQRKRVGSHPISIALPILAEDLAVRAPCSQGWHHGHRWRPNLGSQGTFSFGQVLFYFFLQPEKVQFSSALRRFLSANDRFQESCRKVVAVVFDPKFHLKVKQSDHRHQAPTYGNPFQDFCPILIQGS